MCLFQCNSGLVFGNKHNAQYSQYPFNNDTLYIFVTLKVTSIIFEMFTLYQMKNAKLIQFNFMVCNKFSSSKTESRSSGIHKINWMFKDDFSLPLFLSEDLSINLSKILKSPLHWWNGLLLS